MTITMPVRHRQTALKGMESTVHAMVRPWPHATEENATTPLSASLPPCWAEAEVIAVPCNHLRYSRPPRNQFRHTVQAAMDKFVSVLEAYLKPHPSLETTKQVLLYLTPRGDRVSLGQQLVTRAKDQAIPIPEIVTTALKAFEQESQFITEARCEETQKEAADASRFPPVTLLDAQQR